VAPPGITTRDIDRGIDRGIERGIERGMQLIALVLVFAFTGLATWLPKAIGW
jgi:hypothetical protein